MWVLGIELLSSTRAMMFLTTEPSLAPVGSFLNVTIFQAISLVLYFIYLFVYEAELEFHKKRLKEDLSKGMQHVVCALD